MNHPSNRKVSVLLVILAIVISSTQLPSIPGRAALPEASIPQSSVSPQVQSSLKALAIVSSTDMYQPPYTEQVAINIMRSWGIPFDVVAVGSLSPATFWNFQSNSSRYQFAVYFGSASMSTEGTDPPLAVKAIESAIHNGTNFLFVGPAVVPYQQYFGLSGYTDCPNQPQNGAGVCGETLAFGVLQNFSGVMPGSPSFYRGEVFSSSGTTLTDTAMPVVSWNGTGTEFMNATVGSANLFEPNVIYRNLNGTQLWWWGGTEGQYAFYREGWQEVFYNTADAYNAPQLFASTFEPEIDLFYYALENITSVNVGILPWSTGGSAEVIRAEDHASMCQYSQCGAVTGVIQALFKRGLVGEINVDLNGWSDSVEHVVSPTLPPGVVPPPNTVPGYVYYGNMGATWNDTYFALAAVVDNKSSTTRLTPTNIVSGGVYSQPIDFIDGNTTEITQVSVLVNTSSSAVWRLDLAGSSGQLLYVSPPQTSVGPNPMWINFSVNVQGNQQSSGVPNSIQGILKLQLNVTSGEVSWWRGQNQTDYIILGRSNWDIVYIARVGTANFSNSVPLVPDSILMANGEPYAQDNRTIVFDPQDNMTYPGELHPADIVGEFNQGAPGGVNFEVFFTLYDWEHYGMNAIHNFQNLAAKGWVVDTNGWTHAKDTLNDADNDFRFGNGSIMPPSEQKIRIDSIVTYFNDLIGPGNWSRYWAFGTDAYTYYPALQQIQEAGFTYAQLSTQASSTLDYVLAGYWKTTPSGLYSIDQSQKAVNGISWQNAVTYNQTREEFGVISTHSDSNYPYNDYELASQNGWTSGYGIADTWFCGTTTRCFDFWSATMQMLMNGTSKYSFDMTGNSGHLSLIVNTGGSQINAAIYSDPLVFRVPESIGGLYLYSIGDNASIGRLAPQEGGSYYYYIIGRGAGWLNITAEYGIAKRVVGQTVQVNLIPFPDSTPLNSTNTFTLLYLRNGTTVPMPLGAVPNDTIVVDPGSSMTISGVSIASGSHRAWTISGNMSPLVINLTGARIYNYTFYYYELFNVTVANDLLFGGTPPLFNVTYTTIPGTDNATPVSKTAPLNSSVWMLSGTDWNVVRQYTSRNGTERWILVGAVSGEVNQSGVYVENYYHQFLQNIQFSMLYGSSFDTPSASGYQDGKLVSIQLNQEPTNYWFDAYGSINFTNPISGITGERWETGMASVPADQPSMVNVTYFHQYYLTFTASKPNEGAVPKGGWYNSSSLSINALPNKGFLFRQWSTNSSGLDIISPTQQSTRIIINGPGVVVAIFYPAVNYYFIALVTGVLLLGIFLVIMIFFLFWRKRAVPL